MDCKTARLLLDYTRPGCAELDAAESRALEDHLANCETCDQLARAERRADEAVGKAMRQVEVPDRLRNRILTRLETMRGDRLRRRWVAYGLRGAIAAAAALLLAFGLWRWCAYRPAFPAEHLLTRANEWTIAPPDGTQVEEVFRVQGVEVKAPSLNYNHLSWASLASVEGRRTALLLFNNHDGSRQTGQQALVYIVPDNQFNVSALPAKLRTSNEYEYKCDIAYSQDHRYGYVIYYTGDDYDWLQPLLPPPPESANGN